MSEVPAAPALRLTGGCGCGAVRFEVSGRPTVALYCHCTRCQRRTGTATSCSARVSDEAFHVVQGQERLRAWRPEDGAEKWFCGDCGSALFSLQRGARTVIAVRMGAFDGDPGVRPSARQFVDDAASWEPIPDDGLPRHRGRMP
ncbi:MAG: GFA family protein [Acidobacteriota bacterium]|nr:GFA family protein [Acidobacteriota bacterium]